MALIESEKPGKHPEPPEDLSTRKLPTFMLDISLWRVHQAHYNPLYFSFSGDNRFDAPSKEYGILYLGVDEYCAFRESIGRLAKYRLVTSSLLKSRKISVIKANRALKLVDLSGEGLTVLDADARLCTGGYDIAQRWSLALKNHPIRPDGLYYRSRHDPSRYCVALYEHLKTELTISESYDFLEDTFREKLANILNIYNYGFSDT
jgi:RES domain